MKAAPPHQIVIGMLYEPGTLAREVRLFRKHKRISQSIAAEEIGIKLLTLGRIERGSRPSKTTYRKLSEWTGLSVEALKELKTK